MTAESFDADFAEKIGLVQYVVEDDAALLAMEEYLATLAMEAAPGAIADAKRLVQDFADAEIDSGLSHDTAKRIAARRVSDEGREGIAAFLERRKPNWAD